MLVKPLLALGLMLAEALCLFVLAVLIALAPLRTVTSKLLEDASYGQQGLTHSSWASGSWGAS